jgi:hypothetical protein
MTREAYRECLRILWDALREAENSGNEDQKLGVRMAFKAFLETVTLPPKDVPRS